MGDDGLTISGPSTVRGAVLMLVIGLAATGYGAYDYTQQSNAVEDAVEVDATITDLDIESTSSAGSSTDVSYRPTVRFTYEYEGTAYASTNVFPRRRFRRTTTPSQRPVRWSKNTPSTSPPPRTSIRRIRTQDS